jgi:hypothetical protein
MGQKAQDELPRRADLMIYEVGTRRCRAAVPVWIGLRLIDLILGGPARRRGKITGNW